MKQLKIKSITENTDIKNLIDGALKQIISNNNCQFRAIRVDAKKRSFAINRERLKEVKVFLLGCDGVTQDKLIYNAILKIIEWMDLNYNSRVSVAEGLVSSGTYQLVLVVRGRESMKDLFVGEKLGQGQKNGKK